MQQRAVGRTGLKVSRLGLGTMSWGTSTDEHEAREQLRSYLDAGGNLLDTAHIYGGGASEELLGRLLAETDDRDEIVVATKAGFGVRRGSRVYDASRGYLLRCLDLSLRRLGTDHVDLWQLHVWSDNAPLEETLAAFDAAVTSGRVTHVGISNFAGWQTAQAATWQRAVPGRTPIASTQVEYSLLDRGVEAEVLPAARALGLGVLPYSPLAGGVLTAKYRDGTPVGLAWCECGGRDDRPLPHRPQLRRRRGGGQGGRRARLDTAAGGPGVGAGSARRHGADRRRPYRRPSSRPPWRPRS